MSQLPSGARPANAIRELSGDQAGVRSKRSLNVSRCSPLPSALTAYSSRFPSARSLAKTIFPVGTERRRSRDEERKQPHDPCAFHQVLPFRVCGCPQLGGKRSWRSNGG